METFITHLQIVIPLSVFHLHTGEPFCRSPGEDPPSGKIRAVKNIDFRQYKFPVFWNDRPDLTGEIKADARKTFQKIIDPEQCSAITVKSHRAREMFRVIFPCNKDPVIAHIPDDETFAPHFVRFDPQFPQFRIVSYINRRSPFYCSLPDRHFPAQRSGKIFLQLIRRYFSDRRSLFRNNNIHTNFAVTGQWNDLFRSGFDDPLRRILCQSLSCSFHISAIHFTACYRQYGQQGTNKQTFHTCPFSFCYIIILKKINYVYRTYRSSINFLLPESSPSCLADTVPE